jgi:hypothetical protein
MFHLHQNLQQQDSPWPGLGGSHHLPPYSIFYNSRQRLHPNGSFSQDSRIGVPKLSRVGVPGLWEPITPDCRVRLQRGLKQSCSPRWDLSNAMLHFQIGCREEVTSRLLVVESQTTSLTLGPSFGHNLCFRCLIEKCKPIFKHLRSKSFPMI